MALRVQKAEIDAALGESFREQFGAVPEPIEVAWHNPAVARASLEIGGKVGEWHAVDESLKSFAHMAVAAQVGCGWCLDIAYFQAQNLDLDLAKASQVPRWRESDVARFSQTTTGYQAAVVWLNGAPAARIDLDGHVTVASFVVENGRVARIYAVANPRKLTRLTEPAELIR